MSAGFVKRNEASGRNGGIFFLLFLFIASVCIRPLLSFVPNKTAVFYPEELLSLETAQNIFLYGFFGVYNRKLPFFHFLYPLLLSPFYSVTDPALRGSLIGIFNSLLVSSALFPGYFLARRVLKQPRYIRLSLLLLSLAPEMGLSVVSLSDNLFFPMLTWGFFLMFRFFDSRDDRSFPVWLIGLWSFLLFIVNLNGLLFLFAAFISVFFIPAGSHQRGKPHTVGCIMVGFLVPFSALVIAVCVYTGSAFPPVSFPLLNSPSRVMFLLVSSVASLASFAALWGSLPVLLPVFCPSGFDKARRYFLRFSVVYLVTAAICVSLFFNLPQDYASGYPWLRQRHFSALFFPFLVLFFYAADTDLHAGSDGNSSRRLINALGFSLVLIFLFTAIPSYEPSPDKAGQFGFSFLYNYTSNSLWLYRLASFIAAAVGYILWRRFGHKALAVFLIPVIVSFEILNQFAFIRTVRDLSYSSDRSLITEIRDLDEYLKGLDGDILMIRESVEDSSLELFNSRSDSDYGLTTSHALRSLAAERNIPGTTAVSISNISFPFAAWVSDPAGYMSRADYLLVCDESAAIEWEYYEDITPEDISSFRLLRSDEPSLIRVQDPSIYSPGEVITFYGKSPSFVYYMPSGLVNAAESSASANSKAASLTLMPDVPVPVSLRAVLNFADAVSKQRCDIYAGGINVFSGTIPSGGGSVTFDIPTEAYDSTGHIRLRFQFPNARERTDSSGFSSVSFRSLVLYNDDGILRLPDGITEITEEAFSASSFRSVIIPYGVLEIGPRAFADCTALEEIHIPATVGMVSRSAFEGCPDYLVIYGSAGSWVQEFASEMNFLFVAE